MSLVLTSRANDSTLGPALLAIRTSPQPGPPGFIYPYIFVNRGKVGRLAMCGVNGTKFPGIRAHMQRNIGDGREGYLFNAPPKGEITR